MSRRKPLRAYSFPGDHCYAKMTLTATEEEFACLGGKEYLISSVLDSILQSTALLPKDVSEGGDPPMIASFLCEDCTVACNETASMMGKYQSKSLRKVGFSSQIFAVPSSRSSMLKLHPLSHKDLSFRWCPLGTCCML